MRLELRWSVVDDLVAGPATRLAGRRLEVDVDGLRARLSTDPRLTGVRLDLVHPGERCRIGRVFDVVAPRAKLDGGEDFPGVLGSVARAGQGTTLALDGVAVVATDQQTDSVGHARRDRHGRAERRAVGLRAHAQPRDHGVAGAGRSSARTISPRSGSPRSRPRCTSPETAREAQPDRVEVFELPPSPRVPAGARAPARAWRTCSRSTRISGRPASTRASSTETRCAACCRRSCIRTRCSTAPCSAASWAASVTTWATQNHPMIKRALRPARPHAVVRGRGRHGRPGDRARARALGVPGRRPRRAHARRRRRRSHQDRRGRAARRHGPGGLAVRGARREDDGGRRGHVDRRQRRGHAALRLCRASTPW